MPSTDREASTDTSVRWAGSGSVTEVATPSRSAQRREKTSGRVSSGPTGVRTAVSTPASSIISAAATPSSHTRPSSSASRASETGLSVPEPSRSSRGAGSTPTSAPVARPSHGTNRPIGRPSQTPFGAPSSAAPAIRRGWSSPTAAQAAAASPATTAVNATVTRADTAGRTTRCTASHPRGSGVRREASNAISSTPAHQTRPPSTVGAVSTVNPTAARASTRSPIRSGSSPPMSPTSPSPGISSPPLPPPSPPPGRSSSPSEAPSIVTTSCPAQASPPVIATNSATTEPTRARSSVGATTTPAARRERRKKNARNSAPTRPTPSGVISTAVCAWAPFRPNEDTSPAGVTEPPAPSATTAAVIGPSEPAASASSRCRPSAAVPAMPINAQLTEAIADSSTSPHGTRVPYPSVPALVDAFMADPPIRCAVRLPRMSPSRGIPLSGQVSTPSTGTADGRLRTLHKARLSVRAPSLK
ncbi:hypothetical protein BZZ08_07036 [Streptomyces sp. MH60]|nr:hypothetical protein BZZ08_07036 [Streptomyces sp. MH60]